MNNSDVSNLAARAQACVDAGMLSEAKQLFDELCRIAPDNAEAWLMAGAVRGEMGEPDEALACLNTAIRVAPDYPEAHLTLAHLSRASGALDACYNNTRRALEIDVDYDEAWVLMGAICCELGHFDEAVHASREAISRWPENPQAHLSLAMALCHLGREPEAEPVVREAMALEGANQPVLKALLGQILLVKGDYDKAEALIQAALAATPDDIALRLNMATIRLKQREYAQAERIYRSIIEDSPSLAAAWSGLGSSLQGQYKLKMAEEACQQAVAIEPGDVATVHKLALLQEMNGDFGGAVESLRGILALQPGRNELVGTLAGALEKQGNLEDAIETLQTVLDRPEKDVRVALVFQRLCREMGRCSEAVSYIKALLDSENLVVEDRAMLHFALGDQYDHDGVYDKAFKHYDIANSIDPPAYDPVDYSRYVDSVIRAFSAFNLSKLPVSNIRTEQPVFIVGMPRSGTSLVERILSSHSGVFAGGELRNIIELTEEVASLSGEVQCFPAGVDLLTQAEIDRLSGNYLDAIAGMAGSAARVTDKLPHNFQYIGLIHALFPGAKIIHCVRDALDTCLSCYFKNFAGYHPYASDLVHLGRHYNDYRRLMAHWRSMGIPILDVPYEALVEDPEAWSRKLVEYCGLGWEDQCLRYYETSKPTSTASYNQVRQPIYKSSIGRWKHYQEYLSPLMDVL